MTTDQWDDDPQDQNDQQSKGNGLRAQLERALADNKTLKESNDKLLKQVRQSTISALIKDKGLNPKIAKLIPSDVESTQEALDTWFEENKDLFPAPAAKPETNDDGPNENEPSPEDLAEIQQLTAMGTVTGQSIPPQRQQDLLAKLGSKDLTYDGLMEMINSAGGGYGTG